MIFFVWDEKRCGCRSDIPEYDYELIECLDAASIEKNDAKSQTKMKADILIKIRNAPLIYLM